jgi:Methyltransferase domain
MLRWLRRVDPENLRDFLLRKMPPNGICAEIGVHKGDFSERIISITRPQRLHLIDPWFFEGDDTYAHALYGRGRASSQADLDATFQSVQERFEHEIRVGTVVINRQRSAVAAETFADEYFDWVYIDGNHLYEFVLNDLEQYWPKVKPRGFITGDDYGIKGWWQHGVTRAVDEFAARGKAGRLVVRNHQFILRKKSS